VRGYGKGSSKELVKTERKNQGEPPIAIRKAHVSPKQERLRPAEYTDHLGRKKSETDNGLRKKVNHRRKLGAFVDKNVGAVFGQLGGAGKGGSQKKKKALDP